MTQPNNDVDRGAAPPALKHRGARNIDFVPAQVTQSLHTVLLVSMMFLVVRRCKLTLA